jgi:hypothetical protein
MPRGPKGEKHPADVIGNAAPVCAIAFLMQHAGAVLIPSLLS